MDRIAVTQDRTGDGPCECGDETSGSIKCREFFEWLGLTSGEGLCPMELVMESAF